MKKEGIIFFECVWALSFVILVFFRNSIKGTSFGILTMMLSFYLCFHFSFINYFELDFLAENIAYTTQGFVLQESNLNEATLNSLMIIFSVFVFVLITLNYYNFEYLVQIMPYEGYGGNSFLFHVLNKNDQKINSKILKSYINPHIAIGFGLILAFLEIKEGITTWLLTVGYAL